MSLKHTLTLLAATACTPQFETVEGPSTMHAVASGCDRRDDLQPVAGEVKGIFNQVTKCLDTNGNGLIDTVKTGRPGIEAWKHSSEGNQYRTGIDATSLLND